MAKKKVAKENRSMPRANRARRHDFPHVDDLSQIAELRESVKTTIKRLLGLNIIKGHTSREETLRAFLFNMDKHDPSCLPFSSHGVGWLRDNRVHCLYAEVSCLVEAFFKFTDDPTEVNAEATTDFVEYIDGLCRDQDTIRTIDMGKGCRWRITNARILNGFHMTED